MEDLLRDPIEIGIPFTNTEFYALDEISAYYVLTPESYKWLYDHDPQWTCCNWYASVVDKGGVGLDRKGKLFRFSKPGIAVLFKLRWA